MPNCKEGCSTGEGEPELCPRRRDRPSPPCCHQACLPGPPEVEEAQPRVSLLWPRGVSHQPPCLSASNKQIIRAVVSTWASDVMGT